MQKVIILPVRCSTVRWTSHWMKCTAVIECIILFLLSVIYMWITPEYTGADLDRMALMIIIVGIVCMAILIAVGYIEKWYPRFECIKDE